MEKVEKYFEKHVVFNSFVHVLAGIGFGALLVHPLLDPHPVRFGAFFIILALLGYWYAYDNYKGKK